jgi:hypothetical protein
MPTRLRALRFAAWAKSPSTACSRLSPSQAISPTLHACGPVRVPDAVQRAALAERCTAGPGPFQTPEFVTVPGQQRTTKRCCAAPGTSVTGFGPAEKRGRSKAAPGGRSLQEQVRSGTRMTQAVVAQIGSASWIIRLEALHAVGHRVAAGRIGVIGAGRVVRAGAFKSSHSSCRSTYGSSERSAAARHRVPAFLDSALQRVGPGNRLILVFVHFATEARKLGQRFSRRFAALAYSPGSLLPPGPKRRSFIRLAAR